MRQIGRYTYPLVIVFVVSLTWGLAWSRSVSDRAQRNYWPAKDPALMLKVLRADADAESVDHEAALNQTVGASLDPAIVD